MWSTGRARASCQRSIDSGKSEPQVRKVWISAGCLSISSLKPPKSALSPVSEMPKKTFLPRGSSVSAGAGAVATRQSAAASSAPAANAFRRFDFMSPALWTTYPSI
jgi:hypothetical protein